MKKNITGSTVNITPAMISDFQSRIVSLLNVKKGTWSGTMTQLSYALTRSIKRATPAYWPSSPSVMRRVVNTVLPRLRNSGVSVSFGRATDRVRTRIVSFVR